MRRAMHWTSKSTDVQNNLIVVEKNYEEILSKNKDLMNYTEET